MNAVGPPDKVVVRASGSELVLVFAEATFAIGAPRLRAACRCADCRRERIDRDADLNADGATIAEVRLVGDHALNIAFSDGHDRGIYPWSYLRELAQVARPEGEPREAG
jgi:DUF971 family protein